MALGDITWVVNQKATQCLVNGNGWQAAMAGEQQWMASSNGWLAAMAGRQNINKMAQDNGW